jgi:hypothetical protein
MLADAMGEAGVARLEELKIALRAAIGEQHRIADKRSRIHRALRKGKADEVAEDPERMELKRRMSAVQAEYKIAHATDYPGDRGPSSSRPSQLSMSEMWRAGVTQDANLTLVRSRLAWMDGCGRMTHLPPVNGMRKLIS